MFGKPWQTKYVMKSGGYRIESIVPSRMYFNCRCVKGHRIWMNRTVAKMAVIEIGAYCKVYTINDTDMVKKLGLLSLENIM